MQVEVLEPKPPKQRPKLPPVAVRIIAFLTTLVLLLTAVLVVANRNKLNIDSLRRWYTYRSLERNDSGQPVPFSYGGPSFEASALLGQDLLVSASSSVRIYSGGGTLYLEQPVTMEHPVVTSNGQTAVVYDAGGVELCAFSQRALAFQEELPSGSTLLSVRLNDKGWMAVTAQESGFKGTVSVYNESFEPVMRIKLSSRFIADAVLSPDCKTVALLSLGAEGSRFDSRLEFYDLSRSSQDIAPDSTITLGNTVGLDLRWKNDGVWVLGDTALLHADNTGEYAGRFTYNGKFLKSFSLDLDGSAVLVLGKYRAGSASELLVVDGTGEVTASLPLNDQVLSLSAAGRYLSLLEADELKIYTRELDLYSSLAATQGAQRVLQQPDGSAMLLNTDTARLYIP